MKEGIFVFIKFPVRHGLIACHCHKKPFRQEISRLRFAVLEMTGRRGAVAVHLSRKRFPVCLSGITEKWEI